MKRRSHLIVIVLLLLSLAIFVGMLLAAGNAYMIRSLISSGGGEIQGDGLVLNSAIGQPVAGFVSGGPGEVTLCSGFLCPGPVGKQEIFLPLLIRSGS